MPFSRHSPRHFREGNLVTAQYFTNDPGQMLSEDAQPWVIRHATVLSRLYPRSELPGVIKLLYTSRFAPRAAYAAPLRSLRKEKLHKIMRSGQRSMIKYSFFMIVVANWRLDNARIPPCFRRKQLGCRIRFASGAVPPATLAHVSYVRTYPR